MSDKVIKIPTFLPMSQTLQRATSCGDFCVEVACESEVQWCAECDSQSCAAQCDACQDGACQDACEKNCQELCEKTDQEAPPTPTPERSTITYDNLTSTSVRLIVTRNDATELRVFFREGRVNEIGTTIYDSDDEPNFSPGATWRKTFTGLIPGTWYTYNLWDDLEYWIGGEEFETPPQLLDPWEWWSDVSRDATIAISADEWNAFCDFINEVRVQRGLSRYTAGNFGSMTSDEILSAEGYDHAVYAIGAMIPGFTQEYGRLSEDQIEASLFNGLKDGINSLLA